MTVKPLSNDEVNELLAKLRPHLLDRAFGDLYEAYLKNVLVACQRELEQEVEVIKIYKSQGKIEMVRKLLGMREAVKNIE